MKIVDYILGVFALGQSDLLYMIIHLVGLLKLQTTKPFNEKNPPLDQYQRRSTTIKSLYKLALRVRRCASSFVTVQEIKYGIFISFFFPAGTCFMNSGEGFG